MIINRFNFLIGKYQLLTNLLFVLASVSFGTCWGQQTISYKDYENFHQSWLRGMALYDENNYSEAITKFKISCNSIEYVSSSYDYLVSCYKKQNKKDSAEYFLRKSFEFGNTLSKSDSTFFENKLDDILQDFFKKNKVYQAQLNLALKAQLHQMCEDDAIYRGREGFSESKNKYLQHTLDSINCVKLKAIIKEYGWVGRKKLGDGILPSVSTIVIHANEADNLFFLRYAIKAAENNEASWFDPAPIMTSLLWRFEEKENPVKLRYCFVDKQGNLDLEKSYFQLACLAKLRKDNRKWQMEFFATYSDKRKKQKSYLKGLEQLKVFLISQGVPENCVVINQEYQYVKDDGLGEFIFCFKTKPLK